MSALRPPLKDHLRAPEQEQALARIWSKIDEKLGAADRRPSWRSVRFDRAAMAGGVLAMSAAAIIGVAVARHDAGPLHLADGHAIVAVVAPAEGAVLSMSDGSQVALSAGARFEPLLSTGTSFVGMLQSGRADFEVHPGGPRRWQIECGLATVEVVGTGFSCEREPGHLRVAVRHGVVLVRGEKVRDRAQRLIAGESLEVSDGRPTVTPVAPAATPATPPAEPETESAAATPTIVINVHWRDLARAGRQREAFAALGSRGLVKETRQSGVADLLLLADVARLSGHPHEAVGPFERILDVYPRDAQAPLAAFALGRLELDTLNAPARAATALQRALDLGVPHSLREDVRARLVEAQSRSGNRAATRAAAEAYLREFPDGRYRAQVESQLR
jgi:transmembrane sensor